MMRTANRCDPVRITEEPIKQITGILHWTHTSGKPAHCLARCYALPEKVIVMLSALAFDDPYYQPLTDDYANAANSFWGVCGKYLNVLPEEIMWVGHYGLFSTNDRLWSVDIDNFEQIELLWDGTQFQDKGTAFYYRLKNKEAIAIIPLPMEPVSEVLTRLEWTG